MRVFSYIIPLICVLILVYGLVKKVNIYDSFIIGVKDGLNISLEIFPSIFAMVVSVGILVKSNILNDIVKYINFKFIPSELIPLSLLRPISSSSSLMLLNNILSVNGVDSYVGKIASVITGSTDTTVYIIGLYYGSIKIKKIRHTLIAGLLADFACVFISILVVKLL